MYQVLGDRVRGSPWLKRSLMALAAILTVVFLFGLGSDAKSSVRILPSSWRQNTTLPAGATVDGEFPDDDLEPAPTKYAYVIFLSDDLVPQGQASIDQDLYFVAVRILLYQLLHAPDIATPYDVIVTVTPSVLPAKRERMRLDGAKVIELAPLDIGWVKAGEHRWDSVMQKFRIWQMTQYEKILILDSDVVLQANIDGVFDDTKAIIQTPKQMDNITQLENEAPYPSQYMLSATAELKEHVHKYPPQGPEDYYRGGGYLNAGFMLLKPSEEVFTYYMSMTKINPKTETGEWRFNPAWPEQALLNYVHRWNGPMPWVQLDPLWMLHLAIPADLPAKPKGIHTKWWTEPKMKLELEAWKWRMDAFWQGREGPERAGLKNAGTKT